MPLISKNLQRILPATSAIFVDTMSYALVTPMLVILFSESSFFSLEGGGSASLWLAVSFALFPLGMFYGSAVLGDLSDRFGRKRMLITCMVGLISGFLLMGLSILFEQVWLLFVARFITGFMSATYGIGQAAILDLSTAETKTSNLSKIVVVNIIAQLIGPGLGGILAANGLYWPFLVVSCMALCSLLWVSISLEETFVSTKSQPIRWNRPFMLFYEAFKDNKIRRLATAQFLFQCGNCMAYQFMMIYLMKEYNYTSVKLGLFATFALALPCLIQLLGVITKAAKHCSESKLMMSCSVLCGVFIVCFVLSRAEILLWCMAFLWALMFICSFVLLLKSFSDCVDESQQGWVMGIAWSVFAFAFFVGGLSASLIQYISVGTLLLISAALFISSAFFMRPRHNE